MEYDVVKSEQLAREPEESKSEWEPVEALVPVGKYEADSPKAARAAAAAEHGGGEYVAVASRYWQAGTLKTRTETVIEEV